MSTAFNSSVAKGSVLEKSSNYMKKCETVKRRPAERFSSIGKTPILKPIELDDSSVRKSQPRLEKMKMDLMPKTNAYLYLKSFRSSSNLSH